MIYHNMMKNVIIVSSLFIFHVLSLNAQTEHFSDRANSKYAINEPSNAWILDMVDSIRYQTDLCETCQSPPTFKRYEDKYGRILYRLRYACDEKSSFIMIYDHKGATVAHCLIKHLVL